MASPVSKAVLAAAGSVAAAVGSALCCAGPLVAVALGLSGAGLAATFEPLRPFFVAGTVAALGTGFVVLRSEERKACEPGTLCASPVARRRMKQALWVATLIAIPLITFPWWSKFLLGG
ncbi:MAG TPA: mercuric transporter MerT family protein [Gemmatimonadales bacterium]|nr:mercuric transporter MerT family protein [Gemmatimonadales bacterium]